MSNITLSIDDDVVKKVRKRALEKDTTLTAMVREFLETVARDDDEARAQAVRELERSFEELSRPMGGPIRDRDSLHER